MDDEQKYEDIPGQLDMNQVCHCCGGPYKFDIDAEKMSCYNQNCSAYQISFTIPLRRRLVVVKHHEKEGRE